MQMYMMGDYRFEVGESEETRCYVDATFVDNYVKAVPFFEALGGTESVKRGRDGSITVSSVSPDMFVKRVVRFAPVTQQQMEAMPL